MSNLNRIKVVDFTMGRRSSDDVNTDIPFSDNFEKTRTIQQANVVLGAYVNRNYKDNRQWLTELENKADIDDIPTKTSDLTNDGSDGENPFITNQVNDLVNYTNNTDLSTLLDTKASNSDLNNVKSAIDYKSPNYMGDVIVESIRSKNMLNLESFSSTTINDITFTNNRNGSITINGTASASFGVSFSKLSLKAGNYYLSPNVTGNSPSTFYLYDYDSLTGFGNGAITLSQDYNNLGFDTYINSGYYYDNVVIMPQLETGSVATSFSPYQQLKVVDTGWIDMSNNVNTTYFYSRPNANPMVRKIDNVVYWKGAVYCHTAPNDTGARIIENIPSQFLPPYEVSGSGIHYNIGTPFKIYTYIDNIAVYEQNNIVATQDYEGFALGDIGPYLVD